MTTRIEGRQDRADFLTAAETLINEADITILITATRSADGRLLIDQRMFLEDGYSVSACESILEHARRKVNESVPTNN